MKVIPIILCGGTGERLWPLSRKSKPKSFLSFGSSRTLLQETVMRCHGDEFDRRPIVVGAYEDRFHIASDLQDIEAGADMLVGPSQHNPAVALAAACLKAVEREKDALVVMLPADRRISEPGAFEDAVISASTAAKDGHPVAFGLKPASGETGRGFIKPGEKLPGSNALEIEAYSEKPSAKTAKKYVKEGYLLNSGDLLMGAELYLDELKEHAPDVFEAATNAFENAASDLDFIRLDAKSLADIDALSIENVVLEKSKSAAVLPVEYTSINLGSWAGVWDALEKDEAGNALIGDGQIVDGKNNMVHSDGRFTALLGINDAVVVSMRDSILVAARDRTGNVADIVEELRGNSRPEADETLDISQPWGNFERLDAGEKYQVRRVVIEPGKKISLQKHEHRGEHWILVQGRAEVSVDGHSRVRGTNESVYIPRNSVHELINHEAEPVVMIEVQTGNYLGEDDVIRLEDAYNLGGAEEVPAAAPEEETETEETAAETEKSEEPVVEVSPAEEPADETPEATEVEPEGEPESETPPEVEPSVEEAEAETPAAEKDEPEQAEPHVVPPPGPLPAPAAPFSPQPAPSMSAAPVSEPHPQEEQEEAAPLRKPFPPPAPRKPAPAPADNVAGQKPPAEN